MPNFYTHTRYEGHLVHELRVRFSGELNFSDRSKEGIRDCQRTTRKRTA